MIKNYSIHLRKLSILLAVFSVLAGGSVAATQLVRLQTTISSGSLQVSIKNASGVDVANPLFGFTNPLYSVDCQTITSTLGTNSQRIYIDNSQAAANGWTLVLAASGGPTSTWDSAGTKFDFNDTSGCTDSGDADTVAGRLRVNPQLAQINTNCIGCTILGLAKGAQTSFQQNITDTVTLFNASSLSDYNGSWYFTGIEMDQLVPGSQPAGTYTLDMNITVTAI